jgi:hypothetical protein
VIETEQVQHGGMQIVAVHFAFDSRAGHRVGGAVTESALLSATGRHHGIAAAVMVPAGIALTGGGAAEFTSPQQQCVSNMPRCLRSSMGAAMG